MTAPREWLSAGELAALALPDMPDTKRGVNLLAARGTWTRPEWQGDRWRHRTGRGGGLEFHMSLLPRPAQIKLLFDGAQAPAPVAATDLQRTEMWRWFEGLSAKKKAEAARRLEAINAVEALVQAGVGKTVAAQEVARTANVALSGLFRWQQAIYGVERADRLPHLAPKHAGRASEVTVPTEALDALKADYLRPEQPCFTDCHRRLVSLAAANGWTLPSRTTLARFIDALPPEVVVLARQGREALERMYPAQARDHAVFHAMQAVNADGHKWDVFVRWPDGTVGRPVMVAFQDLYSGLILSWRIDRTEHKNAVRLAFGDMVEAYGIPEHCYLDNGRGFAAKWFTGGAPTRFRFKVRDEDPDGTLKLLGVQVHWATPYHGQSKPIERAFRDFAQGAAKHPNFAGAWTGNTPLAKPENYGSTAVPLDVFERTIGACIAEHNARAGRRSRVCQGQSFRAVFDASYAQSPVRRATQEQRRLWLLAAEALRVSRQDGTIEIEGNRYWASSLFELRGQTVVVRFDPDDLHKAVHVYRLDGRYLCQAEVTSAAGFNDVGAARDHAADKRTFMRATRDRLDAERRMSVAQLAKLLPEADAPDPLPEPRVVRPVFGTTGTAALQAQADGWPDEEMPESERLLLRAAAMAREGRAPFRVIEGDGD